MTSMNLKNFRLSSLYGSLAILFGLIAIIFPDLTIVTLSVIFAIAILTGGIGLVVSLVRRKDSPSKWYILLLEGLIGIVLGVIILINPQSAASFFMVVLGLWVIFIGLILLFTYFKRDLSGTVKVFYLITGIISLVTGLLIIINPFDTTRVITVLIGIYAIGYGVFSLVNTSKIEKS